MTTAAVTPFARYCIDMRWSDMDALGHLNNVNYFRYLEQVRVEWLDSLGLSINPDGIGPVLADTRCSFRREFTYPARIGITLELVRLGEKSLTLRHHFTAKATRTRSTPWAKWCWSGWITPAGRPCPYPKASGPPCHRPEAAAMAGPVHCPGDRSVPVVR